MTTSPDNPPSRPKPWPYLCSVLGVAAFMSGLGGIFLHRLGAEFRRDAENRLVAITDLKVRQLVEWRENLLADAQSISSNPFLADHARDFFSGRAEPQLQARFTNWLASERLHNQGRRALLIDTEGRLRLAVPATDLYWGSTGRAIVAAGIRSNQALLSELHRRQGTNYIHLDLVIPLCAPVPAGAASGMSGPVVGALDCEVDPCLFLFPLLQSWPTPERSGESLLIRKETNGVLFLNEVRSGTNTALALRIPLSLTNSIGVRAVSGWEGIVEANDYKGARVLACIRAVPGTAWWLISKIDQSEAFAGFETEKHLLVAAILALIAMAALAAVGLWRKRESTRLRAELALESQRQSLTHKMLQIARHTNDIVFLLGSQGNLIDANDRALQAYGYSLEEFRRLKASDLRPPGNSRDFDCFWAQLKQEGKILFETLHRRKDGSCFPVEISTRAVELDGEKFYQALVRDITQRRKNEEQLHKLSRAVEQSPASIMITDANGCIEYVNPKFCDLTGYSLEEVRGRNPRLLKSGEMSTDQYRQLWTVILSGRQWRGEFHNRKKSGELYWELASISPVRDTHGNITHFIGIKEDITDRKRAEAELQALQQRLLETARQAGMAEVATSVLHNVGNVLNSVVISGAVVSDKVRQSKLPGLAKAAALLQEHAADLPAYFAQDPKARLLPKFLSGLAGRLADEQHQIIAELASLSANIDHIKQIVAMQQGYARVAGVSEVLSVSELLEDALRINASGFERQNVEVIRQYAQLPPITLEKHKVLQILVNLLRNAKYALQESAVADKRLTLRTELAGDHHLRISVGDNGIGIREENLKRVFELGFTTRKEGHGFGLHNGAIVAKELGGSLSALSGGAGQGATFVLELPFAQTNRASS